MTRHEDNLTRLAKARAKLAETTPGEWRGAEESLWTKRPSMPMDEIIGDLFEAVADAEHIAVLHNVWSLVLDMCESELVAHAPEDTSPEACSHWACVGEMMDDGLYSAALFPCPHYLAPEAILKAVTDDA